MKRSNLFSRHHSSRRRAAVAVLTVVTLVVLVGFAALTVDVGVLHNTRADLQDAADAAAMAGAFVYTSEAMMRVRMSGDGTVAIQQVTASAVEQAQAVSSLNYSFGASGTVLEAKDVTTGWIDAKSNSDPIHPEAPPSTHNAVQVVAGRTSMGPNGAVEFFFATIFGKQTSEVSASAVAIYDDRFVSYDTESVDPDVWPFTMDKDVYKAQVLSGDDRYSYDEDLGQVMASADGTREINLYPGDYAPGNFGLLNIGTPNQSMTALSEQITNGVQPEDFELETGSSVLTFYDANGNPTPYSITGNPGLKADLESSVTPRIGDLVGFFLHDSAVKSGANTTYRITQMRFGRVMGVNFTGALQERGLWIQPVSETGPGVAVATTAPSSGGMVGKIVLAR